MDVKISLPLLPLRDIVVFPSMVIPLFVGRDKSISALNEVMKKDKKIILVTQKNSEIDDAVLWQGNRRIQKTNLIYILIEQIVSPHIFNCYDFIGIRPQIFEVVNDRVQGAGGVKWFFFENGRIGKSAVYRIQMDGGIGLCNAVVGIGYCTPDFQ